MQGKLHINEHQLTQCKFLQLAANFYVILEKLNQHGNQNVSLN